MMGAWSNNEGRPAAPDGMRASRREDGSPEGNGNVSQGGGGEDGRVARALPQALLVCAIGGALCATSVSMVSPALVAYGLALALASGGLRGAAPAAALAVAAAAAVGSAHGTATAVGSVVTSLSGLALAAAFWAGRLTPGGSCLVVAAISACHLGADAFMSALAGTTLEQTMTSLIGAYRDAFIEASPASAVQVSSVASLIELFWPTMYVGVGFVECVSAHLGIRPLRRVLGEQGRRWPSLTTFDAPLWLVAALVATAAALAVALTVPEAPSATLAVSANLAMALRFAFAVQGLGVVTWLMRGKGMKGLTQVLLGALALYLEVQFIVLTVVGVVDVWANFRHLSRGAGADGDDAANQDKEPAQAG